MKTKTQFIAECKETNPVMTQIVNGVEVELTSAEYDKACEAWADMRIEQQNAQAKIDADEASKAALLDRLGLTADEAKLLLS